MLRTRKLPGITFRAETPATVELPRMDIAAFVGFAQRGPLHTPVAVESIPEFEGIFGGLYRLAWDDQTDTWQMACLAPAVKAFFAQGGRRCWVVRVASTQAVPNHFPIAGLLQTTREGYRGVLTEATSVGSWSDALQVRAELQVDPLTCEPAVVRPNAPFSLAISGVRGQTLEAGDMVQLDCADNIHRSYAVVESTALPTTSRASTIAARTYQFNQAYWFAKVTETLSGSVFKPLSDPLIDASVSPVQVSGTLKVNQQEKTITLEANLTAESGDWLRLETSDGVRAWFVIEQQLGDNSFQVTNAWLEGTKTNSGLSIARLQRLELALRVREKSEHYDTFSKLAFAAPHPRYIGYLPDDDTLFDPGFGKPNQRLKQPAAKLWEAIKHQRFALSFMSEGEQPPVFLPLGLDQPGAWRGAQQNNLEPLLRDGLSPSGSTSWATFITELFLDPRLRLAGQGALLSEANDYLYLKGQSLIGLHSLIPVEEVSLIAVPDAAHREWVRTKRDTVKPKQDQNLEESPNPPAPQGPFIPCGLQLEAKANKSDASSDVSKPENLPEVPEDNLWKLISPSGYTDYSGLLKVQVALSELAAARGDLVAVLGVPKHYQIAEALTHQQLLGEKLQLSGDSTNSYVALYHPWLISRTGTGELIHTHPAGHVCGAIAARSLSRGAWVAPANEGLHDVLATLSTIGLEDELAFYQAGINPIRGGANGFVIWGSYTQSAEPYLEDLNVRRLLILLRRIALTEGQTITFAPHSPAFQRRVKQQFEQCLSRLFQLGAFAGKDPSEAYQVVLDETLNTPASIEQGSLIVDLRVAPSRPLMFMTVRLIQSESGVLASQEVIGSGG
jgi:hypothetical protein